jgi:uncharacterized protein (TIGR03435 family)
MNGLRLSRSVIVSLAVSALAQAQGGAGEFEVASVKPHGTEPVSSISVQCANGRLMAYAPLGAIIIWAYDLRFPENDEVRDQLPAWATGAQNAYRIDAHAAAPVPEAECRIMLRALLAERFKLALRRAPKEETYYELAVGPGGAKMQPSEDGVPGVNLTINGRAMSTLPGVPVRSGMTMADLANSLGVMSQDRLLVVDKTGLGGKFKVTLAYSTDPLQFSGPDLDTALQKQLGLKLERRKGPIEHFMPDHIERPDSN